jgi:hypothetical protein
MTRGAIELIVLQALSNYGDNCGCELIKIIEKRVMRSSNSKKTHPIPLSTARKTAS